MISIGDYIKDVRGRSDAEKQRAVLTWTIVCVSIIFIVWLFTFTLSFVNDANDQARLRTEAQQEAAKIMAQSSKATNTPTPVSRRGFLPTIGSLLSDGVSTIANGFWIIGDMLHKNK